MTVGRPECVETRLPQRYEGVIPSRMIGDPGMFSRIQLIAVISADKSMSPMEIWSNESQERYVLAIHKDNKENFEKLMSSKGISPDDTVVFYGDKSNWWACYALWTFKIYGHENCLIMNGGRQKWVDEKRAVTKDIVDYPQTNYKVSNVNSEIRAFRDDVRKHSDSKGALIDVRSPKEYSGELLHMEAYPQEGALRGGHIPNAQSVPCLLYTSDAADE